MRIQPLAEAPEILDGCGVRRAAQVLGESVHGADVVRLRLRLKLAHTHVVDHALRNVSMTLLHPAS